MSSGETPYVRATSSMILPTVTGVGWSLLTMSLIARCAVLIVGVAPSTRWIALSFLTVPSSWRMLLLSLTAMNSQTLSGTVRPTSSALRLMIAMRVSKSGGCTSAVRPHSKRVFRRSSSVAMSRGGRSLVRTICFFDS